MRTIITTTLFILLLFTTKLTAQIPFEIGKGGHIEFKAKINGVEGKFIFDTGAGINAILTKFSKKIENEKTSNFFVGHRATGEELNVDLYQAKSFEINDKHFDNQKYAIIDMEFGDIDGIISLQPFRETPVTIDYINKKILFNKSTDNEKSIDIQLADYAGNAIDIFTYVDLNDSLKIQILLDSGAGQNSFWFSSKLFEPLKLEKSEFKVVPIKSDFNKENNYYIGSLAKLNTNNHLRTLENLKVAFVDGLIYEGKTSIEWLGKVLTIDIPNRKIFIEE